MKNLIKQLQDIFPTAKTSLLLALTLSMVLFSCKKALDTKPSDFIEKGDYYKTKDQFKNALAGIYGPLGTNAMYGEFLGIQLLGATDEGANHASQPNNGPSRNDFDYTNAKLNGFWSTCYVAIERANLLIENAKNANADVDAAFLNEIVGEAKFLRGYYHFLLVQNFGDIPLKITPTTNPNDVNIPRTPAKQVYEQIIKDMTEAEAVLYLPNHAELANAASRVSKPVAQGMLARVCLFMAGQPLNDQKQYANALMWAKKVQTGGINSLVTSADTAANVTNAIGMPLRYALSNGNPAYSNNGYAQLFVNLAKGLYTVKEMMWEAESQIQTYPSVMVSGFIGGQLGINCPGDRGDFFPLGRCVSTITAQPYLYNLYGAGDLRRDWNIAPYQWTTTSVAPLAVAVRTFYNATPGSAQQLLYIRQVGKYRREYEPIAGDMKNKNTWETSINYPLLRYADVLLMLAEAEFMVNGATSTALDAINQVRRRGYGFNPAVPNAVSDLTSITINDIRDERARELAFEGLRRNDLRRWGIYLQRVNDVLNSINQQYPASSGNKTNAVLGLNNTIATGNKFLSLGIPSSEMLVNKAMTQNQGW